VERAVHRRLGHVGGLGRAEEDVAEFAWATVPGTLIDRKCEYVGRLVHPARRVVERPHPALAHDLDADVPVTDPGGVQGGTDGSPQIPRDV